MNAIELADELEACFTKADWNVLEAATMLRQQEVEIERITSKYEEILHEQQAEIKALKKEVKHWQDAFHKGVRL